MNVIMSLSIQDIRKNLKETHPIVNRNVAGIDIPLTSEELELWLDEQAEILFNNEHGWKEFRSTRDHLLTTSDWTQITDAPVNSAAWAKYRQELRDLPATIDHPTNVKWPEPPK